MSNWKVSITKELNFDHERSEKFEQIICDFSGDAEYYIVKKNGKYGAVKEDGRYILPIEFDKIKILNNGMIIAENKNGVRLLTKNCAYISEVCFFAD